MGFVLRLYLGSSLQGLCFSSLVFTLLKQSGGSLCYQQRSFFIIIILSTILRGTSTLAEIWVTYCASLPQTSSSKPVGHDCFENTLSPKMLAVQLKQYKIMVMK